MQKFHYERLVVGYHGCDQNVLDEVISGKATLKASSNAYDWLGKGIYFWEYGRERAYEWALEQQKRKKIDSPAVIGAFMYLGNCFDLSDVRYTRFLGAAYPEFVNTLAISNSELPENSPRALDDADFLLRHRDCAMMNWSVDNLEQASKVSFHTVRGLFQEGIEAFPGSYIREKSHIQIAVRDTACILGYFLPT